MLRRLLVGLVLGFVVGGLVAAGLVAGLHVPMFIGAGGAVLAYLAAAATGVLTGLVAGKPIWASGAKIEAGLKAFFGALLGVGLMFVLRQWATWDIDLSAINAGHDVVGALPAAALPMIAALLGAFFELDNTGEQKPKEQASLPQAGDKKRIAAGATNGHARARLEEVDEPGAEEAEVAPRRAKR